VDTLRDVLWHHRLAPRVVYRADARAFCRPIFAEATGFHMLCVVEGRCWGLDDTGTRRELEAGDLLIAPHGGNLSLHHPGCDHLGPDSDPWPRTQTTNACEASDLRAFAFTGTGASAGQITHPLLDELPNYLTVQTATVMGGVNAHDPCLIIDEILGDEPEPDLSIIGHLAELVAARAIEGYYGASGTDHGFLRALRDPEIGRAIAAIHAAPGRNWSLERLATTTGLSRSAFSRRFTALAGVPAMKYLTSWRMRVALEQLQAGNRDIEHVANDIGYRSPVAFQKAFKRVHGLTPAQAASA